MPPQMIGRGLKPRPPVGNESGASASHVGPGLQPGGSANQPERYKYVSHAFVRRAFTFANQRHGT